MPTPPWYGHLLRGVTEVRRKPGTAARGSCRLGDGLVPPQTLHVACQIGNCAKHCGFSGLPHFGNLPSRASLAQSTHGWEKSTCSGREPTGSAASRNSPLSGTTPDRMKELGRGSAVSMLIAHSGQSGAEKSLEAFSNRLVPGHRGGNRLLRQRPLIAQID